MNASEAQLQGILNSPNRYIVPVFQRYYSWEKENWEQLWEDIEALMEDTKENKEPTHFMGSLVFIPEQLLPNKAPTFQIIDGQQRMMTILILLCGLRNVAKLFGYEILATEINNTYIVHQYKQGVERYRVYPRHQDKEDFEFAVTGEKEPENRVGEALSFFTKKILQEENLKSAEQLETFKQILVSGLEFVHITLGNENPYQIFKSLNSTGVNLEEGDLIRNYVFMHLKTAEQNEFDEKHWKPLEKKFADCEGNLDGKLISSFFRDFLMRNGKYVRKTETYKSFENEYVSGLFDPKTIVKELHKSADLYNIIQGQTIHTSQYVEESLGKLRELDSSTTYPLILKLFLLELPLVDIIKAIDWLSSFILRRFVCQESSRAYGKWFVAACEELREKPIENLRMFLLSKGFPSDTRFAEQFKMFNLYGSRYTKAILARIEQSCGHKEPVNLTTAEVEHIMPQLLNDDWKNELGSEFLRIHESLLHTIGNLTLTGYNPELSNKHFKYKKLEYANSHISLTKMIADYDEWNEETILSRGELLIERAKDIWKAPESITPGDATSDDNYANNTQVNKLRKMITRRRVPQGQLDLFQIVYQSGDDGISWSELVNKMNRTRKQMSGVLGALGVRINFTEGLDDDEGINHVFDIWEIEGEWYYRMKPEFKEAIEQEGIVNEPSKKITI